MKTLRYLPAFGAVDPTDDDGFSDLFKVERSFRRRSAMAGRAGPFSFLG